VLRRLTAFAGMVLLAGCHRDAIDQNAPVSVTLTSPSFQNGQPIPVQFTCHGANSSPALSWEALPSGTKSVALTMIDQSSLFVGYVHWLIYNLPAQPNQLPENIPHQETLPGGASQGRNGNGSPGYTGPCPPGKSAHHYMFTVYALNDTISVPAGAGKGEMLKAMQGHVLAVGKLEGTFQP
jgi:Raf kinase inhibitor-like YbhB/YbcL family protein